MTQRAHIGFYERNTDKIGKFFTLFYLADSGKPEDFMPAFEAFSPHIQQGIELVFSPELMADKLGHYLWAEGQTSKVELAKEIKPDVDFFYKVSLGAVPTLEVYQIEYAQWEVGEHPSGRAIVWGRHADNTQLWRVEAQPSEWKILLRRPFEI